MTSTKKSEELFEEISALNEGKIFGKITEKVISGERISDEEALLLFEKASLGLSGTLANYIREKKHGDTT
ncbi:MAG: hypothetical protein ABI172_09635, partial [Ginsengibacter sp.]